MEAYRNDMSEECVRNAAKDIEAFERLQERIFGTTRSEADKIFANAKRVTFQQLMAFLEDQEDANVMV